MLKGPIRWDRSVHGKHLLPNAIYAKQKLAINTERLRPSIRGTALNSASPDDQSTLAVLESPGSPASTWFGLNPKCSRVPAKMTGYSLIKMVELNKTCFPRVNRFEAKIAAGGPWVPGLRSTLLRSIPMEMLLMSTLPML
jgi:hypothetical protein